MARRPEMTSYLPREVDAPPLTPNRVIAGRDPAVVKVGRCHITVTRHDIRKRQVRCEVLQVVPSVPRRPIVDVNVERRQNQAGGPLTHEQPG